MENSIFISEPDAHWDVTRTSGFMSFTLSIKTGSSFFRGWGIMVVPLNKLSGTYYFLHCIFFLDFVPFIFCNFSWFLIFSYLFQFFPSVNNPYHVPVAPLHDSKLPMYSLLCPSTLFSYCFLPPVCNLLILRCI